MTRRLLPCLALLALLLAAPLRAAWLEGVRWFRHDAFTRVVFDLSAPVGYRVSEHLAEGYVDVVLAGEPGRKVAERIAINEGGVIEAARLRGTSTSQTWRLTIQGIGRVRHMSVDEQPYKVALDLYPAVPVKAVARTVTPAAPARPEPQARPAVVPEPKGRSGAKAAVHATGPAHAAPPPGKPAPPQETAVKAKTADEAAVGKGKGDPGSPDQRYEGLKPDERRRLLVGELLLQLGDSAGATPYLEQVREQQPTQAWCRYLLAQIYLSKGDEYRALELVAPLKAHARWKPYLDPLLRRLHPPDAQGAVPGGEMAEEDLDYYINVLRQGGSLNPSDLYAKPAGGGRSLSRSSFLPGLGLGALLGLLAFAVAEWRRRGKVDKLVRDRIMGSAAPAGGVAFSGFAEKDDYAEVSKRVREELEQVMVTERDAAPEPVATPRAPRVQDHRFDVDFPPAPPKGGAQEPPTLEEKVYALADQKKSIVEIAEELNLGVDEVRLHLELREQAGSIRNA